MELIPPRYRPVPGAKCDGLRDRRVDCEGGAQCLANVPLVDKGALRRKAVTIDEGGSRFVTGYAAISAYRRKSLEEAARVRSTFGPNKYRDLGRLARKLRLASSEMRP